MDIILILFIAIFAVFLLALGIFTRSWSFTVASGIFFLILGGMVYAGVDINTGRSGLQSFNISTSDNQIYGNSTTTTNFSYERHKDTSTDGAALILSLIGLLAIYIPLRDTYGG